jgi:hypothetical protein
MSNIMFGDAKSLHRHLVKFTAQSGTEVHANGETAVIEHSQFASFDLQDAFETIVENTDADPRDDKTFREEVGEAAPLAKDCFEDRDLHYHYDKREYFEPNDIRRVTSTYEMYHVSLENGELPRDAVRPRASTREAAIAELFTAMLAKRAEQNAFFQLRPPFLSDDEESYPDEQYNPELVQHALRDTTASLHGPSGLRQPDPSLHTTRCLYNIYDEVGMRANVRQIYGVFVAPTPADYYKPTDATGRVMQNAMGRMVSSAMGRETEGPERWTSENEPPLESLDSYNQPGDSQPS